jgi:hypothetical protein
MKGEARCKMSSDDLSESVKELRVAGDGTMATKVIDGHDAKECVSFGTDMSTEDESSASESLKQATLWLDTVMSKMQERKKERSFER